MADVPVWYDRYRELRNRQDSRGDLSHGERAELDELETRLAEYAAGPAADLNAARSGGRSPQTTPARDERVWGPNPDLDAVFDPQPPAPVPPPPNLATAAAQRGAPPPPPPQPAPPAPNQPPQPPNLQTAASYAGTGSRVSAFDRPIPVIVMGPRPVPVTMEGGEHGGGAQPPPAPPGETGPSLNDRLNDLIAALAQPSAGRNQSGSNLFGFLGRAKRIGGGLLERAPGRLGRGIRSLAGRGGGRAAGAGRAAAGASRGAAGAAAAGGRIAAAAGPVGIAVGAAVQFASAVVEFGQAAHQFVRAQESVIRHMGEVGPVQAAVTARLDAQRVGRDIQTARETAGSSEQLIQSLNRFEEAMRPIESLMTDIANIVGSRVIDAISDVVEAVEQSQTVLGGLAGALAGMAAEQAREARKKDHEGMETSLDMLRALDNEEWKKNQPMWPAGNGRRGAGR